jgi:origin recognition complex subunit 3
MCHFYANPLVVLSDNATSPEKIFALFQPQHFQAVRMLPSFKHLVEALITSGNAMSARDLLKDNLILQNHMVGSLRRIQMDWTKLLQRMHILSIAVTGSLGTIELFTKALEDSLSESDGTRGVLDSIKRMAPDAVIAFIEQIQNAIQNGCAESDLDGWLPAESDFNRKITGIKEEVTSVVNTAAKTGKLVRSSYAIHSKGLRTTVIAKKVQLSYEKSTLTQQDTEFTELIDRLSEALKQYLAFETPQSWFLTEVWLYDSVSPYKDVFAPRPRFTVERALSTPSDYLPSCDPSVDVPFAKPPSAIVYQMYLESGSLVNVADIWEAFLSHVGVEDGKGYEERTALMLLYRGLADLKLLGMVKQSKKKTDHLAKSSWIGL